MSVPVSSATQTLSIEDTLKSKGYQCIKRISRTLQGSVWAASNDLGSKYIVKVTEKSQHEKHVACIDEREIEISEDILKESGILKHLTLHNPPPSLTKFVDFFQDSTYYYLCMEFGGQNLFDFIKQCHEFINCGRLDVETWLLFCKSAMSQITNVIHWMHNTMHCCHLDISLENFVIDNVGVVINQNTKKIVKFADFQIKIIDFGLAEVFAADEKHEMVDFRCSKYVGKTCYKSPEVYQEQHIFDARFADCWSLGCVFFMMVFGCPPFQCPSAEDALYRLIIDGQILSVLSAWHLEQFAKPNLVDLFRKIFVQEKDRMSINEIEHHPALTS